MKINIFYFILLLPLIPLYASEKYFVSIGYVQNKDTRMSQNSCFNFKLQPKSDNCFIGSYAVIFDGHYGPGVAEYGCKKFYTFMCQFFNKQLLQEESLKQMFIQFDRSLREGSDEKFNKVGASVAMTILKDNTLYVANLGDVEIINAESKALTQLHRVTISTSDKEIKSLGGEIISSEALSMEEAQFFIRRKNDPTFKINLSRTLGDFYLKEKTDEKKSHKTLITPKSIVSSEPAITTFNINALSKKSNGLKFIIMASSGIWDNIKKIEQRYQETIINYSLASEIVNKTLTDYPGDLMLAAKKIVALSIAHEKKMKNDQQLLNAGPVFIDNFIKEHGKSSKRNQIVMVQQFHEKSDNWTPFPLENLPTIAVKIKEDTKESNKVEGYIQQYILNTLRSSGVTQEFRAWFRWYISAWLPQFIKKNIFTKWFNEWIKNPTNGLSDAQKKWYYSLIEQLISGSYLKSK